MTVRLPEVTSLNTFTDIRHPAYFSYLPSPISAIGNDQMRHFIYEPLS